MRKADPVASTGPTASFNVQAMKSSAAAAALQASSSGQQDDGMFGVLDDLIPGSKEKTRRQVKELTAVLAKLNQFGKRDDASDALEKRQLGLVKSAPEAVGQIAQLARVAESLPIKRSDIFDELGVGKLLDSFLKRDGEQSDDSLIAKREDILDSLLNDLDLFDILKRDIGETDDHTAEKTSYTEQAFKGFHAMLHDPPAKDDGRDDKQDAQEQVSPTESLGLGDLVKGDGVDHTAKKTTYTEQALKGFHGMLPTAKDDKKDAQQLPSATESLGLVKRGASNPLGFLTEIFDGTGIIGKREVSSVDEAPSSLPSKKQLGILSGATSALSNAGSTVDQLGQFASSKHRRDDGGADASTEAAMASLMGMGMDQDEGEGAKEDDSDLGSDITDQLDKGDKDATDAMSQLPGQSLANEAADEEPMSKRQVPPIAGGNALSVVQGFLMHPENVVKPVTEGLQVGGKSLEDLKEGQ